MEIILDDELNSLERKYDAKWVKKEMIQGYVIINKHLFKCLKCKSHYKLTKCDNCGSYKYIQIEIQGSWNILCESCEIGFYRWVCQNCNTNNPAYKTFFTLQENSYSDFEKLEKLAKNGDMIAQYELGLKYQLGIDVEQNYKISFKWFMESAKQGDLNAQYYLGIIYKEGNGVEKNKKEAISWYKKSAEQGHELAKYGLDIFDNDFNKNSTEKSSINGLEDRHKKSGGCFIATAVYNSPTAPKVIALKEFRDQRLLTNSLGERFVQFYYRNSPPIANFLSRHKFLSEVVRVGFVEPLVWVVGKRKSK